MKHRRVKSSIGRVIAFVFFVVVIALVAVRLRKEAEMRARVQRRSKELEVAAQADMGVAIAEMRKSKRAMLREWRQICERYKLPLAGAVAVRRCW